MVELNENVFHKRWTESEMVMSSTWRELKAVQLALDSFSGNFIGKNVLWHTNIQNCENCLRVIALCIFDLEVNLSLITIG